MVLFFTIPYILPAAHSYLSTFSSTFVDKFVYIFAYGFLGYCYFKYLQKYIYNLKTNREYGKDHADYKRSWSELIEYFKDSDPYRIQPSTLPVQDWKNTEGIILGKVGNRLVKRDSAAVGNLAVFGLPGCGKTTSQIITSALQFAGSTLVIDIKGDVLNATKCKRNVKVFAPEDAKNSCHFNPFEGIATLSMTDRRIFIENIANIVIQDEGEDDGKFFVDGGRDYFCGIALYLLSENINTTFPEVTSALLLGNAFDWVRTVIDSDCQEAKEYLASYFGANEKNVAGCYAAACKACRPLNNGDLATLLDGKGDCISMQTLEDGNDIYIEIPQDKIKAYAPITTIIVQNIMTGFQRRPDSSSGKELRPILMILDEFPQLRFDFATLTMALSTLRSKKVTLFLAQQSIAQISKRYGEDGFREIMDTCAYISIMSAQDPKSREYFQKLIGQKKVLKIANSENNNDRGNISRTVQETTEFIYQPEDFGNLGDKVVICANGKYIEAEKTYWFK